MIAKAFGTHMLARTGIGFAPASVTVQTVVEANGLSAWEVGNSPQITDCLGNCGPQRLHFGAFLAFLAFAFPLVSSPRLLLPMAGLLAFVGFAGVA